MPDEDKNFGGSLVLDFGKWWRHVKTIYTFLLTALQAATILVAMVKEKYLATKTLAKVANWRPTDFKT